MHIAQVCEGAATELRRIKAPASCISIPDSMEVMAWKIRTAVSNGTVLSIYDLMGASEPLVDLGKRCEAEAHFPEWKIRSDTAPTAAQARETARMEKDADAATKAANDAEAAADDAQKAAIAAMNAGSKSH